MNLERLSKSKAQVQMNLTLEQLSSQFLLSRRSSNFTPDTIRYYEYVLSAYTKWVETSGQDYANPLALRTYLTERLTSGEKPRTSFAHYRGLKTFFRYCFEEELLEVNPIARIKAPKVPKDIQEPLTEEEIRKIEKAIAGSSALAIRNKALFYLLLDSGLRLAECSSLKVGDVDLGSGTFKVRGKGQKDRFICVSKTTIGYLTRYIKMRNCNADSPLWIGINGPMTKAGIAETLEKIGKKADVHLTPHKVRRTFAVFALRNGMNLRALQRFLGHADISTTTIYLNLSNQDLQDEHVKASPVEGLSKEKLKVG